MEQSSLKKTLLDNIEIQEAIDEKFNQILRRQTNNFIALIFMMFVAMGAFIAILTRPIHVDRELIKHIEQERTYIVAERRRQDLIDKQQLEEKKIINTEKALIQQQHRQILEARQQFIEMQKLAKEK